MNGNTIDYSVIRSNRKTLSLEVREDCTVLVRAPARCPKKLIETFVESRQEWIAKHLKTMRNRQNTKLVFTEDEKKALIARARAELPKLVSHYAGIMGVHPTGITITGAEKRFGSCSGKNRLCFSWRLMSYPQEAIEYVVVHELAHIPHKNHGPDFYAFIAAHMPDHKERRKLLRR